MLKKALLLPLLILATGFVYIAFIPEEPLALKITFKLIPMFLIIFYGSRLVTGKVNTVQRLIIIGLFVCMIGDASIAVSFVAGLAAFLVGHLFYITGFWKASEMNLLRLTAIIPIAIYAFLFGRPLLAALRTDGTEELILPVIAYITVISLMALTAIMTGNKWAIIGSILFVISDSILSWNLFVSEIPYSNALIMTTYYSAQFLIATSLLSFNRTNNRSAAFKR